MHFDEELNQKLKAIAHKMIDSSLKRKIDPSGVVQDLLLDVHLQQEKLQGRHPKEQEAWMIQRLLWKLKDALRKPHVQEGSFGGAVEASSARIDHFLEAEQLSPSAVLVQRERKRCLDEALDQLTERERKAIILFHWQKLKYSEIAQQLDCTHGAVIGLIQRGRNKLAALLPEEELLP